MGRTIRKESDGRSFPIVVMNQELKEAAISSKVFNTQKFIESKGNIKDIEGEDLASWQFTDH